MPELPVGAPPPCEEDNKEGPRGRSQFFRLPKMPGKEYTAEQFAADTIKFEKLAGDLFA